MIIHGFVEELVVNEDPEYQWIDRIRTPRASNEARQRLISLMSGINKITSLLMNDEFLLFFYNEGYEF